VLRLLVVPLDLILQLQDLIAQRVDSPEAVEVGAEVADEDLETEDVEVDEVVDAAGSTIEDEVDQEVAVELRPTVVVSETSRARSRLFKSRGIALRTACLSTLPHNSSSEGKC